MVCLRKIWETCAQRVVCSTCAHRVLPIIAYYKIPSWETVCSMIRLNPASIFVWHSLKDFFQYILFNPYGLSKPTVNIGGKIIILIVFFFKIDFKRICNRNDSKINSWFFDQEYFQQIFGLKKNYARLEKELCNQCILDPKFKEPILFKRCIDDNF
jgi:hypothetical protein